MMILKTIQKALRKYDEVVFTQDFIRIDEEELRILFVGKYFRFQNHESMIDLTLFSKNITWQDNFSTTSPHMTLIHEFSREIGHDGFELLICPELYQIKIKSFNRRGFNYAINLLSQMIMKQNDSFFIPVLKVKHTPSFSLRGVIEGFYGTPWTHEMRLDCIKWISHERMNTYMYAPKDDDYQRKLWREPYPSSELDRFQELITLADTVQVDFWYMISPGNDISILNKEDLKELENKLQQLIDLGVTRFGLLMDDIDYTLSVSMRKKFSSNADMHAYLINYVYDFLVEQIPQVELVACPTEYDNHMDSYYLMHLTKRVNQNVPFFWTGPSTLARQISESNIKEMSQVYEREMIIWDNVPVNDFEADNELLFLSPYKNRSQALGDKAYQVKGIVLNPMPQWELSKFTVASSAQYMWQTSTFDAVRDFYDVYDLWTNEEEIKHSLDIFCSHFKNRHIEPVRWIDIELAIERGETKVLGRLLEELREVIEKIKTIENNQFQLEISPWVERIKLEWELWNTLINEEDSRTKMIVASLKEMTYRVGSNIPLTYYNTHFLNEIEIGN